MSSMTQAIHKGQSKEAKTNIGYIIEELKVSLKPFKVGYRLENRLLTKYKNK